MDCEISANGNKLSPCLHKDTEIESPYNVLCAGIARTIISFHEGSESIIRDKSN